MLEHPIRASGGVVKAQDSPSDARLRVFRGHGAVTMEQTLSRYGLSRAHPIFYGQGSRTDRYCANYRIVLLA